LLATTFIAFSVFGGMLLYDGWKLIKNAEPFACLNRANGHPPISLPTNGRPGAVILDKSNDNPERQTTALQSSVGAYFESASITDRSFVASPCTWTESEIVALQDAHHGITIVEILGDLAWVRNLNAPETSGKPSGHSVKDSLKIAQDIAAHRLSLESGRELGVPPKLVSNNSDDAKDSFRRVDQLARFLSGSRWECDAIMIAGDIAFSVMWSDKAESMFSTATTLCEKQKQRTLEAKLGLGYVWLDLGGRKVKPLNTMYSAKAAQLFLEIEEEHLDRTVRLVASQALDAVMSRLPENLQRNIMKASSRRWQ
jgi:hypothetical protein